MPDSRDAIREQIRELVQEGERLVLHETLKGLSDDEQREFPAALQEQFKAYDTVKSYQSWYGKALRVVEQLTPDRYNEFVEAYRPSRAPKLLDPTTYTVSHYLAGIRVTRGDGESVFDAFNVYYTRVALQTSIVRSALDRLDSLLADIKGVLEAQMFDDELAAAQDLLKKQHLRAAGVIAGVVLERHLKRVCAAHKVRIRKQAPTIGDLNDLLKAAGVYDVPRWREIQLYADIRNYAGHDKEREPGADEIGDLINGVTKLVKTVF